MKKKKWLIGAVSLMAVIAVVVVIMMRGGSGTASADAEETAKTGSISAYYSFSGNVEIKNSQNIISENKATVREVLVEEGDSVSKGERVVRLSSGETIKANVSGEVTRVYVEVDDDVNIGDALIDIVDFDHLEINVKVDEYDVSAVSVGKTADVTISALGQMFEAQIIRFDKQASRSGDISYYIATLEVPNIPDILPGMQVDAKILNQSVDNATVIPMSALKFDDSNSPYVTVKDTGGGQKDVAVSVGVNDGTSVEIVSGVRSGETVLIPAIAAGAGFPDGMSEMRGELNAQ